VTGVQRSLPLFGPTQPWQTQIYRRRLAFRLVETEAQYFRSDFHTWLEHNYRVWEAFEREANLIWQRGRRHYSARTIGEYLRHESQIREGENHLQLKLNDHWWPDLARLYMLMHPDRDGFFERRAGPMTRRAA
jgi:hypothetical protein